MTHAALQPDAGPMHQISLELRARFLVPVCSCGWVGTARMRAAAAREEARDHALLYASADLSGLLLPEVDAWDALAAADGIIDSDAPGPAERDPDD